MDLSQLGNNHEEFEYFMGDRVTNGLKRVFKGSRSDGETPWNMECCPFWRTQMYGVPPMGKCGFSLFMKVIQWWDVFVFYQLFCCLHYANKIIQTRIVILPYCSRYFKLKDRLLSLIFSFFSMERYLTLPLKSTKIDIQNASFRVARK